MQPTERIYKLLIDASQATRELEKTNAKLNAFGDTMKGISSTALKVGATLLAAFSVSAVASSIKGVTEALDNMGKAAQKVGTTVESLSAMNYAAKMSGVSIDQLQQGLGQLSKNLGAAGDGNKELARAFKAVGLEAGNVSDSTVALTKIAEQFAKMPDGMEKSRLAMQLFGKSGKELIPLLNEGASGIEKLKQEAERLGIVMSNDAYRAAEQFNDNLERVRLSVDGLKMKMVENLLPALKDITDAMSEAAQEGGILEAIWVALGGAMAHILGMDEASQARKRLVEVNREIEKTLRLIESRKHRTDKGIVVMDDRTFQENLQKLRELGQEKARLDEQLKPKVYNRPTIAPISTPSSVPNDAALKAAQKAAQDYQSALDSLSTAIGRAIEPTVTLSQSLQRQLDSFTGINKVHKEYFQGLIEQVKAMEDAAKSAEALAHWMEVLDAATLRYAEEENRVADVEFKRQAQLDDMAEKYREMLDPTIKLQESYHELFTLANEGIITWDEYAASVKKVEEAFAAAQSKTDPLMQSMTAIGDKITSQVATGINNMIDALGEAEISFGDFVESALKDLAKLMNQMLVIEPLAKSMREWFGGGGFASMFANAKGNSFGNLGLPQGVYHHPMVFPMAGTQPRAFAHGGTFGVMAERGAEAIVPLKRTASGDLGVRSSPVIVNVNNSTQAEVSVQQNQGPDGATVLNIMVEKKVREMLGKGNLDRQMMVQYGLTRQPA